MTAATSTPDAVLVDRIRGLAVQMGELPSRNKVMSTFKVGSPKATAALEVLRAAGFEPTPEPAGTGGSESDSEVGPVPGLHVVKFQPPVPVQRDTAPPQTHREEIEEPAEGGGPDESAPEKVAEAFPEATAGSGPGLARRSAVPRWPLLLIALPAFIAVWSGWVGLGKLTGFGVVALLPGIADGWVIDTAITLPIGVEAYASYALWVWLGPAADQLAAPARRFAAWSAVGSLALGAGGQVAYHLMVAAGMTQAPWQITAGVACLPVLVIGCAATLVHLSHKEP